jgi:hypothetical protein
MKIAIDESGDSGRKFWRGSSKWFILTAVIVPDNDFCGPTCQAVEKYRKDFANGSEMHFAHNSHDHHINFLTYMRDYEYVFASVVIDKRRLLRRKPQVFRRKMVFLQYSFDKLFRELKPWLDNPMVLMDTSGNKHFNRALSRHLIKMYGAKHKGDIRSISHVRAVDSRNEPLVQLADYVAGAIHHHVDGNHPNSTTFEECLADKGKIYYL